jgi:putative chitinase
VDVQTFAGVMGNSLPISRYQALLPAWNQALIQAHCTTVNRVAMWCAQVGHESLGLRYMNEIASGAAYEGRKDLGNTHPGDGVRFKGHGPIQITGRANHTAVSKWAYANSYVPSATYFVDNPAELGGDRYGFLGVVWYWTVARSAMNSYADAGNVLAATKAVNGGTNGLADRTARWRKALTFGSRLLPTPSPQEDTLSAQFEADARARWPKEDQLEKDLRADLHVKQLELDQIKADVADLKAAVAALSVQKQA